MGSFYGNFGGSGGGGGGTTNYNDLSNKPITNLIGVEDKPIVFADLSIGEYLIKGFYIYTSNDVSKKETSLLHINISIDNEQKICKFEKYENNIWFMYIVLIRNEEYFVNKYSFSKPSNNILFIAKSDLPEKGVEEVLYITETTIEQWRNNKYILLADSKNNNLSWGYF